MRWRRLVVIHQGRIVAPGRRRRSNRVPRSRRSAAPPGWTSRPCAPSRRGACWLGQGAAEIFTAEPERVLRELLARDPYLSGLEIGVGGSRRPSWRSPAARFRKGLTNMRICLSLLFAACAGFAGELPSAVSSFVTRASSTARACWRGHGGCRKREIAALGRDLAPPAGIAGR